MAEKVIMPKAGQTMEEGTVVRWLKEEGDRVAKGEPLLVVSTDKADLEVESFHDGVLLRILVGEGEVAQVLDPIAIIGEEGEEVDVEALVGKRAVPAESGQGPAASAAGAAAASAVPSAAAAPAAGPGLATPAAPSASTAPGPAASGRKGRIIASPLARKIAREKGIDLSTVRGTGPGGRIVRRDVEEAAAAPAAAASPAPSALAGRTIQLTGMRKAIAGALQASKREAPHFYLRMDVDMTAAVAFRDYLKTTGIPATFNDLVVRAAAIALGRVRELSCRIEGDRITYPEDIHIGVAVGVEEGLVVPVVVAAQKRNLADLVAETRRIVEAARGGRLVGTGQGTFTISNLGMFGIESFQAVINPPEGAILAVGAIQDRLVAREGGFAVRKMMSLTLSVDHRAIDGVKAARFLHELKGLLEKPEGLSA